MPCVKAPVSESRSASDADVAAASETAGVPSWNSQALPAFQVTLLLTVSVPMPALPGATTPLTVTATPIVPVPDTVPEVNVSGRE